MNARLAGLVLGVVLATALMGCSLTQTALRQTDESLDSAVKLIRPRRCRLDILILARPQGEPALNEQLWSAADEQVIDASKRQLLEANGLRCGIVTGELPLDVLELTRAAPPNRPEVLTVIDPAGTPHLIDTGQPPKTNLSLFLSLAGQKVQGKSYTDAKPFLRIIPSYDSASGIQLKVVPELHHGPVIQGYGMVPQPTGLPGPAEFQIKNGQKEESFRDLSVTLDLKPDQVAVLGCLPERSGSLGELLYQKPEGNSDRITQSVVLVWARRDGGPSQPVQPDSPEPPPSLTPIDPADFGTPAPSPPSEPPAEPRPEPEPEP